MDILTKLKDWITVPRLGSLTAAPKSHDSQDTEDDGVTFPSDHMTPEEMERHCQQQLKSLPPLLTRQLVEYPPPAEQCLTGNIRIMQWNLLSQALGVHNDNFTQCPACDLDWGNRRYRILEEIAHYSPDIIGLQEVDHFKFLQRGLGTMGYEGTFFPKPSSPCLSIKSNNGPDGCALFYRTDRFELLQTVTKVIDVWKVQSNQVAVLCLLRERRSGRELCVTTTHLKARPGALNSAVRLEQGRDLMAFVAPLAAGRPVLLCGDFNAEPTEPVYGAEPRYTTWKIRATGEVCHTLDYVFISVGRFAVTALLPAPTGEALGPRRAPSLTYPSDHFSLVVDLRLLAEPA
ncbi:nocturnin-like isoform X2 [Amphibalanus amphitrite]|uniref:nocturnin-like isoform X2 n=1 Tax=Amphibalanus amphitrite TaxID=1232801 RepID=UPI001C90538D|nr:nocturnin-like isoform X2 [Amphibalanus amphitrite]